MLFAKKSKGFCLEIGEHNTLLARLSGFESPIVIEELKELPSGEKDAIVDWTKTAQGKGTSGYVHATCGVYPPKRIVRRHTLDVKRAKDPAYFTEIYTQQFRVEAEKYTFRALNPDDGAEYDQTKGTQKEVLFCGLPSEDIIALQDDLLAKGVYPERLELASVATLGGVINYLQFKQSKTPVLVLEIGEEATQSFIVGADGVDISRSIPSGVAAMIPIVQKELGLKDEESAKKLFYSNTFDFTSMGGTLVKKLLKELQSSIGFYEVQTGQSIGSVLCTQLPSSLNWLAGTMAGALGVPTMKIEIAPWAESLGIKFAPEEKCFGLISLIASHQNAVSSEKK
jgi:hypothetical protein